MLRSAGSILAWFIAWFGVFLSGSLALFPPKPAVAQITLLDGAFLSLDADSNLSPPVPRIVQHDAAGTILGTVTLPTLPLGGPIGCTEIAGEVFMVTSDSFFSAVDLTTGDLINLQPVAGTTCAQGTPDCPFDVGALGDTLIVGTLAGQVVQLSTAGTLISSFDLGIPIGGITSDGTDIFLLGLFDGLLRRVTPTGVILSTTAIPSLFLPLSLTYSQASQTFFASDGGLLEIVEFDLNGTILSTTPWVVNTVVGIEVVGSSGLTEFRRGDTNIDGSVNIADAIFLLGVLFPLIGSPPDDLLCRDAADANDDGGVNIADAIAILDALFQLPAIPLPFPGVIDCGEDTAPADPNDLLGCAMHPCSP